MNRRIYIISGILMLNTFCGLSQGDDSYSFEMVKLFEQLAEQSDEEIDFAEWLEMLEYYRINPLNLNKTSQQELKQLFILNDYQIAMLIEYRRYNGAILSISELGYLPGYRNTDVQRLKEFVTCDRVEIENPRLKELISHGRHQVLVRYQRVLEEQEGYSSVPDSILQENPNYNRYLGSPHKVYGRYTFNMMESIKGGIIMEKDAGEEFMAGSNPNGFDFYSASLAYSRRNSLVRNIVIGDYHIRSGQGLLMWSSYAFGKSSSLMSLSRNAELLSVNRSVEENRFLRGTAVTLGRGVISITGFVSEKRIDASLVDTNTSMFTSFATNGYHATPNELAKENTLKEQLIGGVIQIKTNRLQIGVQSVSHRLSKELLPNNTLYKAYSFSGKHNNGLSANYRFTAGRIQLFGETAYSNHAWATLNGALLFPNSDISIGILHRDYSPDYYSYWANAFSESSGTSNEEGYFVGCEARIAGNQFKLYTDVFAFPWLRYRVNAPSEGYEIKGEWIYSYESMTLSTSCKHEQKLQNYYELTNLYALSEIVKQSLKLRSEVLVKSVRWRNRIQFSRVAYSADSSHFGIFVSQEADYKIPAFPITLTGQIAWFRADDYNNRFYIYERDVLYAAITQMYYGRGLRYMGIVRWEANNKLTLWLKFGQSRYPPGTSVSSGLNAIAANHRSEIKVQLRWKF